MVSGHGTAFFLLALTLKGIPAAIAYAVWPGLGLIISGVLMLNLLAKMRVD